MARRCRAVWAEHPPLWLARLASVAKDCPVEVAGLVLEHVEALQNFRLLAGCSLFGPIEGGEAERAILSRARSRLAERYAVSAPLEASRPKSGSGCRSGSP